MGRRVDQLYAAGEKSADDREFLFSVNTYHMKLHLRIAECARCPALRDAIEKEQVLIFNWLYDTAVQRRSLASDYHTRLTEVLARGSVAQADAAMDIKLWTRIAQAAEQARIHFMFWADGIAVRHSARDDDELSYNARIDVFEPLTVIGALAAMTERIVPCNSGGMS